MANDLVNYAVKAPIDSVMKFKLNGVDTMLALPRASDGSFDLGSELARLTTVNCRGITVTAGRPETGQDPKGSLKFGLVTPDVIALSHNRQFKSVASESGSYERSDYDVPPDGIVPALSSDTYGFGNAANAVSTASYVNSIGLSVPLVQDPTFATFDPEASGNELKFAVGANGAMKFGKDLWEKSVSFSIPLVYTNFSKLGSAPFSGLKLKVRIALINLTVVEWIFPSITIDTAGATNFKATEKDLNFFVNGDYEFKVTGKLSPC